jgi:acetylornithine/N-succinyldiaminopimelate aminotransferase
MSSVMPTYARYNVSIERGEGVYIFGTDGRRYLDFGAGIAVNALGHCHPHLVDALKKQAETIWHCSNLYTIADQERLADRLVQNSFADSAFFANSGGEAVELACKTARKYHAENGHPERYRIISIEGAFHGRSLAMIAAGRQEKHMKGFGPLTDGFDQVAFGNLNEMRAAITPETAAILVEPVQGEGGIRPMDADYLRSLRQIADEFGLLLLMDEVQTGVGRTGKLFAHEWYDAAPDVMALAKGLGGGFPIGACLVSEKVTDVMTPGSHGSTFGGNPMASAVGNAVLDVVLADGFLANVGHLSSKLMQGLEKLVAGNPGVFTEVRGKGLMIGLRCTDNMVNGDVVQALMAGGMMTVPAGDNIVRLLPPLVIEDTHVDEALSILTKICQEMVSEGAG